MIQDRTIVCIASSWDYDPTSKHHVMKTLSEKNNIVWVNYHGTRRPRINRSDLLASLNVLRRVSRGVCAVNDAFVQITPFVIPGVSSAVLRKVNERILIAQIRKAINSIDGASSRPVQVWCFAPDVPYLVGAFDEECFLYYCVDEYSEFDGMDAKQILKGERQLLEQADLVVTTSQALLDSKRKIRPDATLVRHGVDYHRFAQAWQGNLPVPDDIASIDKPIFGFFGLIESWVDTQLIEEVARRRPNYAFVLIGDSKVDTSALAKLDNVYLLGRRPNEVLPAYCAAFEAGLLPFKNGCLTRNVNPIKMYEYLAAGLPVVSTPMPEAERFAGPITIVDSVQDFAETCDRVIELAYPKRREDVASAVENESWTSKVELLSELIQTHIAAPIKAASMPKAEVLPASAAKQQEVDYAP